MLAYSSLVEFTPIYKQCDKDDCLACTELACRVNQGKVPYEKVEPLMKRFMELKEASRISKNSPCYFGDCDMCPNVSCGVWHGLAPEPTMPENLKARWQLFWLDCRDLLFPELKMETDRSDVILQNAIHLLESWKEEGVLEERLRQQGFKFD